MRKAKGMIENIVSHLVLTKGLNVHDKKAESFYERVVVHSLKVTKVYNEISQLDIYMHAGPAARKTDGLKKLFYEPISAQRRAKNIKFLIRTNEELDPEKMKAIITCHDIGKTINETNHEEESAQIFDEMGLSRYFDLKDKVARLLVKCAIKYHGLFGGMSLGEYSSLVFHELFMNRDIRGIMSAGKFPELTSTLAVLFICDIASKERFIPLHRHIEDAMYLKAHLDDMSAAIIKGELISQQIYYLLHAAAIKQSGDRMSRYLGACDEKLDQHTKDGTREFYSKILNTTLAKMFSQQMVTLKEWQHFMKFFALMRSNVYSGGFINYILYDGHKDRLSVKPTTELNMKAIQFLVKLALRVDIRDGKPIDIELFYEKYKEIITRKLDCRDSEGNWDLKDGYLDYAETLRKEINKDPEAVVNKIVIARTTRNIVIGIPMPEEKKDNK